MLVQHYGDSEKIIVLKSFNNSIANKLKAMKKEIQKDQSLNLNLVINFMTNLKIFMKSN